MILHVDMDAFFASIEQRDDPRIRGKPVLVCGADTRSVVAAASYEARPFGVHAGIPVTRARRLCPQAILVPGNPAKYVAASLRVFQICKRYTPLVEPTSIDEAFLDFAGTSHDGDRAGQAARSLQEEVEKEFSLTCSVGIGPNKLVAKMASSLMKPRGFTWLTVEGFRNRFWPEPTDAMWGVGEKTARALELLGIRTIGDLARAPECALSHAFGVNGPRLRYAARGEDETPVIPYFQGVPNKSMGHEHTLDEDVGDLACLERWIVSLSDQVTRRMRKEDYVGRVVVLKLRYSDFTTFLRQRALRRYTDEERVVSRVARSLLRAEWSGRSVRLIGVSVAGLESGRSGSDPIPLFAQDRRYRRIVKAVDRARDRFGETVLVRAAALR